MRHKTPTSDAHGHVRFRALIATQRQLQWERNATQLSGRSEGHPRIGRTRY